jgi:hypothetical protein
MITARSARRGGVKHPFFCLAGAPAPEEWPVEGKEYVRSYETSGRKGNKHCASEAATWPVQQEAGTARLAGGARLSSPTRCDPADLNPTTNAHQKPERLPQQVRGGPARYIP